ncbi:hypothetical protein [Mycobacterium sp. DL440]|uniref:hypothetical protein n=1 Tax=Mycobacterium sp. DL440 TaxID=2675523 RepID=UPI001FB8EA4E|nr:hypothetical protein [Mycobacterium sp. DL440]
MSPSVGLAGDHSAVPMGAVMFACAALAATVLLVLTRGHVPGGEDEIEELTPEQAGSATS